MNEFDLGAEVKKESQDTLERIVAILKLYETHPEFQNWIAVKRLAASLNKRVIGREGQ